MGKAFKWIRALLGCKNSDPNPIPPHRPPSKKRWSFAAMCHKEKDRRKSLHGVAPGGGGGYHGDDASRQAIVVAAATAAAAETAVKAAQAAAAVVRLTTRSEIGGGFNSAAGGGREERAAVTIQSHFRAYLSRRALRALKALVKIQALVRGHITRKKAADDLRRMHAIVRAQARARAGRRVPISEGRHSIAKSSHFNHSALMTWEKFEQRIRAGTMKHEQPMMLKRNGLKSFERSWDDDDDERSDKILEVDSGRPPHLTPKIKNRISHSCQLPRSYAKLLSSPSSSGEVQSLRRLKFGQDYAAAEDDSTVLTSENSPLIYSPSHSSKTALFTPTKSDGSKSCMSGYSDHPSYMAYTESAKAKTRSLSAPKQRPGHQYERSSSMSRYSSVQVNDGGDDSRTNKGYPGSGRLDKHGMPVGRDVSSLSGGHWLRY